MFCTQLIIALEQNFLVYTKATRYFLRSVGFRIIHRLVVSLANA